MKQTEIKVNLDALESIRKEVGDSYRARVGVLGGTAHQTDGSDSSLTNATLMLIMMFGSITKNIPPRDPLLAPILRHRRDLIRKLGGGQMKAAFERRDYKAMFALLGVAGEEIVQQAFETSGDGTWPPNRPATIKAKGSSKPLINTSQLRRSVSSDVVHQSGKINAIESVGAE